MREMLGQKGNYVTCSLGQATCNDGRWGACVGSTIVTKSASGATLGAGGLRALAAPTGCADACDPACLLFPSRPGDVDAAGIVAANGGPAGAVTLAPGACPPGHPTTLTGVVRDPSGTNPVNGAYVYVPADLSGALPPLPAGASCDPCSGAVPTGAVAAAQTGPDGNFVLSDVPSSADAPAGTLPLVVQLGKWRREVMLSNVPACQSTSVGPDDARLPRSASDGYGAKADLPKLAIATGRSDPFECLLLKIGISPSEFQLPSSGAGHVDYFVSNGIDFGQSPQGGQVAPDYTALVGSPAVLRSYDAVLLPCEGAEDDGHAAYAENVAGYADGGGRLFTTHYGYTWLAVPTGGVANPRNPLTGRPNPFFGAADWTLEAMRYPGLVSAGVDTTLSGQPFATGQALATWLATAGATDASGALWIEQPRRDVAAVNAPARELLHDTSPPGEPFAFSFDAPLQAGGDAGGGACGRVTFTDFHVSGSALVSATGEGACYRASDCGFTATCAGGRVGACAPVACVTSAGCAAGESCPGGTPGTCQPQACSAPADCASGVCQGGSCACADDLECASGRCNAGQCAPSSRPCAADADCGRSESCVGAQPSTCQQACRTDADCGSSLCVSGQCGGCLDGTFCASAQCRAAAAGRCSAAGGGFPLACRNGPLTPQEEALEFMLFDLTSCVGSPVALKPPSPPTDGFVAASFSEDFSCPVATRAIWRHLDWEATVPGDASIVFSAQTADTPPGGGPPDFGGAPVVVLATATTSTTPPGDLVYIDTGVDGGAGRFNQATPPIVSRNNLRVTVTLNPTSDGLSAPTLLDWQVWVDCVASE
ncbi:MAG: hypothetical protein JOZ69_15225 [Myxococcales bacterium]|nr:hypothetical protein [Myxococcales bacterium]